MKKDHNRELGRVLKQNLAPLDAELQRDLWPAVQQRITTQASSARPTVVPWYDWALLAISASVLLCFPRLLLVFAYYL
jgi:hypothetical protein